MPRLPTSASAECVDAKRSEELELQKEFEDPDILCDPVTKQLLREPVRVRGVTHKYAFDLDTVKRICRDNGGDFKDPMTNLLIRKPKVKRDKKTKDLVTKYKKLKKLIAEESGKDETLEQDWVETNTIIQQLDDLGAIEFAQYLRNRFSAFRQQLTGPRLAAIAMGTAVAVGTTATVAGGTPAATGVGLGVAAGGLTAASAALITKYLRSQHSNLVDSSVNYTERTEAKVMELSTTEEQAAECERFGEAHAALQRGLEIMERNEEKMLAKVRNWCSVIGSILGGCVGVGGAYVVAGGFAFLGAATEGAAVAGAVAEGAAVTGAVAEGGVALGAAAEGGAAMVGASLGTVALYALGGILIGALIGYGVYRIGKYNGWWVSKEKED